MSPVAYFVIGLLAFLFGFGSLIAWLSSRLSHTIAHEPYKRIEQVILGGIMLGTILMFQPWDLAPFEPGFLLLLVSTLAYIAWSHVTPQPIEYDDISD